jgi:hypothetical protein
LHRDASVELAVLAILLFAGIATANLRPRTGPPEELSPGLLWLAFGVVFGTTAALIDVTQVVGFLGLGLALVGLRALGLFVAARTTSWLTGNPGVVSPGFVALLPQAGFSLVLVDLVDDPTGSVHALALAVVLINALVMPLVLDRALRRAESATRHRPSRRHTAASFRPRVPNGSLRSHAP